jgi:Fe-S-cluster containining protein
MKKHTCSIYKDRPEVCKVYPFEEEIMKVLEKKTSHE